ncbi:D-amino-acid transaminase [Gammaproteobacteria bacterium]|nr:D-amino-acid transaminase [Gammaproteobacteria bacterium]MDC1421985.1 D-amino-acid transaminase [Gammaproteobacteria bacterium]MDC1511094.1 D-amino-acid transaminase [Gammaproteobacteria bacterium]
MTDIVFVNGHYLPKQEATISVFDRGFIFGDGVYEVVPVINGKMVDKIYFLERLARSLGELEIEWPCSSDDVIAMMNELITRNAIVEGMVYLQITRGIADRDFAFPAGITSSIVAFASMLNLINNPAAESGIPVITTPDLRWKRRDIKSVNLLGQVLAKQDAYARGGKEGWMVEDGVITEGVSSSAYIVKDKTIITRPLSNEILPGIRRRTLLELCAAESIKLEQRLFTLDEALGADESFISSATTIVLPVVSIDGQKISSGKPGPITQKLRALYVARLIDESEERL